MKNPYGQSNQRGYCICSADWGGCGRVFRSLGAFDAHLKGPDRVCDVGGLEEVSGRWQLPGGGDAPNWAEISTRNAPMADPE